MTIGTVAWFNSEKGFGFIAPEAGGRDIFVHVRELRASGLDDLRQGDRVVFDVVQDAGGKAKATRLRLDENRRAQAART
jgi:CspA family cold shock protein